jgi:hypothetical protein
MPRPRARISEQIPSLKNWGGVRSIERRMDRSNTLVQNREAVAYALLCMANTKITDIMDWDESGQVKVKRASDIPEHALQAIKNIRVRIRWGSCGCWPRPVACWIARRRTTSPA